MTQSQLHVSTSKAAGSDSVWKLSLGRALQSDQSKLSKGSRTASCQHSVVQFSRITRT